MKFNDICLDIPINETKNFGNEIKNSTYSLSFIDTWSPPLIYYPYGSILCGPIVKIVEESSKRLGYNVMRIEYPRDRYKYIDLLLGDQWRFVLHPLTAYFIEAVKKDFDESQIGYPSRALGMLSDGVISTIPRSGHRHRFEFVLGFEVPVWITLLLTMLFIPIPLALIEKSFSGYFTNLWNYSYLILSETIPKIPKSPMKRFVLTFWLLACTVLLSGYAGVLRRLFMKVNPVEVIELWEQLYLKKDMKILAVEGSALDKFVRMHINDNEMARDFASRLETIKLGEDGHVAMIVFEKLFSGYAVSCPENILEDCNIFAFNTSMNKINQCKKIHVSKYGLTDSPYFMLISRLMSREDSKAVNKIILISQESGLFDKWTAMAQESRTSYDPEFNKNKNEKYQSETFSFSRLQGLFILWSVGLLISIMTFIYENIWY